MFHLRRCVTAWAFIAIGTATFGLCSRGQTGNRGELKPEVRKLLNESLAAYGKLKAYQHTAIVTIRGRGAKGPVKSVLHYALAVDRPNKFCFKNLSAPGVACVCDGITFINFNGRSYSSARAPSSIKDLPLVKDVLFQPLGTYVVALMLQGDWSADEELKTAFEKATVEMTGDESGRKWQILVVPYGTSGVPARFYFDPVDHMLGMMTQTIGGGKAKLTETFASTSKGFVLEPALFAFRPPLGAMRSDAQLPAATEP